MVASAVDRLVEDLKPETTEIAIWKKDVELGVYKIIKTSILVSQGVPVYFGTNPALLVLG